MSEHDRDPELDRLLSALSAPEPSASLRRAVAEIPLRHPRALEDARGAFVFAWRTALLASALVFVAGALSGVYGDEVVPQLAALDEVAETDEAADEEPWQDLTVLAFASELDEELAP